VLSISDQENLAAIIVERAKSSARIDTGALRRSISFGYVNGILTFRELFYGQFGTNSELEKLATAMIPRDTPWNIQYTTFGGAVYTKTVKKSGRKLGRNPPKRSTGKSSASQTTNNLRNLISLVNENRRRAEEARKLRDKE
jgi:hypothetical protein